MTEMTAMDELRKAASAVGRLDGLKETMHRGEVLFALHSLRVAYDQAYTEAQDRPADPPRYWTEQEAADVAERPSKPPVENVAQRVHRILEDVRKRVPPPAEKPRPSFEDALRGFGAPPTTMERLRSMTARNVGDWKEYSQAVRREADAAHRERMRAAHAVCAADPDHGADHGDENDHDPTCEATREKLKYVGESLQNVEDLALGLEKSQVAAAKAAGERLDALEEKAEVAESARDRLDARIRLVDSGLVRNNQSLIRLGRKLKKQRRLVRVLLRVVGSKALMEVEAEEKGGAE